MKKIIERQNQKLRPKTLGVNAKVISWAEHVEARHLIDNFTTVIEDKAFVTTPAPGTVMVPIIENFGDHGLASIVIMDIETGIENRRKNVRHVDMLTWAMEDENPAEEPQQNDQTGEKPADDIQ